MEPSCTGSCALAAIRQQQKPGRRQQTCQHGAEIACGQHCRFFLLGRQKPRDPNPKRRIIKLRPILRSAAATQGNCPAHGLNDASQPGISIRFGYACRLLQRLVDALDPDVICLQETKVPDDLFPDAGPPALGYPHVARRGMKGYNGVAILSRIPLMADGYRRHPTGARKAIAATFRWRCNSPPARSSCMIFTCRLAGDVADTAL